MLYGVFSDVHSNIEALGRVLDFFKENKVAGYICCGDIVGYGSNPNECLAALQELKNLSSVCGNHDLAALGVLDSRWFNPYARAAIEWTGRQLSPMSRKYLAALSPRLDGQAWTMVHGTPRKPVDEYFLTALQFQQSLDLVKRWPLFIGHSHMPICFRARPKSAGRVDPVLLENGADVVLGAGSEGISPIALNPGSVGQPRDHDPRASCALYDDEKMTFRVVRLNYDIASAQAKIRRAGLPDFLAARLEFGR
ncbi:MAG: metallophosphoesterase family protein [Elusimicrobiota bacterium]